MYLVGFFRNLMIFLLSLAGLCLFTVRRERCRLKFYSCILIALVFQYFIFYFMFTEDVVFQGISLSKILTVLMMLTLIFGCGLFVYGGWSRVGFYLFVTDMILGALDRLYWAAWEIITHRSADQSIIYYEGNKLIEWNSFFMYVMNYAVLFLFMIMAYKLRHRPLRPEWLIKTVVIIYIALGASPLITRTGFETVGGATNFISVLITIFVWALMFFLVITTMNITSARENRRILYLRKQVMTEQSRILMTQKERLRRLRHDVKKHLSNLDYILEREPELSLDGSFLKYREWLNSNVEWMQNEVYCDSSVMNLCLGEMKRYCDSKGIALDIVLKRLDFSKWTREDELMFGTLLLDLLEMISAIRPVAAFRLSGDHLMGQNVLRMTMEKNGIERQDALSEGQQAGKSKDRKILSSLEKDIRLVLSKYEGRMEHEDDGDCPGYVMSWEG